MAERLHLEPQWSVETAADNHTLAIHTDLAGWYAHARIDDDFIDRARGQLGDALIDRFPEARRQLLAAPLSVHPAADADGAASRMSGGVLARGKRLNRS